MANVSKMGSFLWAVAFLFLSAGACGCTDAKSADKDGHCETGTPDEGDSSSYGVDVSFPIHHRMLSYNDSSTSTDGVLGDREAFYVEYLLGCREYFKPRSDACDQSEAYRLDTNARQPASSRNYTSVGYKKMSAPADLYQLLIDFWRANADRQIEEDWSTEHIYSLTRTNHWASPTYMVSVHDPFLHGGGESLVKTIMDGIGPIIRDWVGGIDLIPTSVYGIRTYTNGSILSPHVDRESLVSSAIINIDQDLVEPWPLEVYGRDGKAHNITMKPGDMVLYESHSLIHGRPFPLRGKFLANIFVHFQPVTHYNDAAADNTWR